MESESVDVYDAFGQNMANKYPQFDKRIKCNINGSLGVVWKMTKKV